MKTNSELDFSAGDYICNSCAEKKGGKCPAGHCATYHRGICDYCGSEQWVANIGDFNWPDGRRRGMRD